MPEGTQIIIIIITIIAFNEGECFLISWVSCERFLIDHFTVVGLVTWPLNGSEAGVDLVLIKDLTAFIVQIKLFLC